MIHLENIDRYAHRGKLIAGLLLGILLLTWFWWPETPTEPVGDVKNSFSTLPEEVLKEGKYFPLPYEGKRIPGRPPVPMPIPKKVYDDVELLINGKHVRKEPIVFPAGNIVQIEGVIWGQPGLPWNTAMSGGVGIVQKAKNKRGWILHSTGGSNANTSTVSRGKVKTLQRCTFDVKNYKLPEIPGEYLLVITSCAVVGMVEHPELLAAEYDLVIE